MGGYGVTYNEEPQEKKKVISEESLVSSLCNEAGYNREGLEEIELETKIDLTYRRWGNKIRMDLEEKISFPEPYSYDKLLKESKSTHHCYAFVSNKNFISAFTKVDRGNGIMKIKIKEKTKYIEKQGIIILRRKEKNLEDLSSLDANKEISKIARKNNMPLKYIGHFLKKSKESFIFNPTSGRIFVISTNLCELPNKKQLYQLETEYYGQVNGFSHSDEDVYDEIAKVTGIILKDLPRLNYSGKNSTLSKFEWFIRNIK